MKNRRLEIKKALSKQEMNMMKRSNDAQDVWGGGRDNRDRRQGEADSTIWGGANEP